MVEPINVNLDITDSFRQTVFKLVNTYKPSSDFPENFKDIDQLANEFSETICDDFAKQLKPLFAEEFIKEIQKHMS